MDLGNKVKKRRLELGMSQQQLADRMGYSSRASINKIEKGRPISQKIIQRLVKALNVSFAYFVDYENKDENELLYMYNNLTIENKNKVISYCKYINHIQNEESEWYYE